MRHKIRILIALFTVGLSFATISRAAPTPQSTTATTVIFDGTLRRIRVPILMYHYVSDLPPNADAIRIGLTVAPSMFRAHLQYLHDSGYTTISLYQLHEALLKGTKLPPKPIILTFDDSYIDHYFTVFPLLKEFSFTATFFVITGTADTHDPAHLSWVQISEMSDAGMSMESHTKTHAELEGRSYDFLVYQLLGSLQSLEAYTHKTPHMFAYPSGRYDAATLAVLQTLPVWRAVTTQHGALQTTDNMLELPRLRVSNDTGVSGLANLLNAND